MAYYKKKVFDKAVNEFKQTIELNPQRMRRRTIILVHCITSKGLLGKSVTEHKSAIQLDKNYPEASNNLGIALYAKG